jgi:exoribonuclease-2
MSKQAKVSGFIRAGCVVEFLHGNAPQVAWVLEESAGRLKLLTVTKREAALAASRILPWTGPEYPAQASREEILRRLTTHEARRRELASGLDLMAVWELSQGEVERAGPEWFAGLVWPKPGPDEVAALGRAMLEAKTHFRFQPPDFEVHPADTVEARLKQRAEEEERARIVEAGQTLFKELWAAVRAGRAVEPDMAAGLDLALSVRLADLLKAKVAGRADERDEKLWSAVSHGIPDQPGLALVLAQAWGVLPPHHNQLLDEAGYDAGDAWSAAFAGEVARQTEAFAAKAVPPEATAFTSIDAATTRDIDDAVCVEALPGGGFSARVALARPTLCWEFGSDLDRFVRARASSLYLPEGASHMLPEALGTDLFSLVAGRPRPGLVAEFRLDAQGAVVSVTPRLSWIEVRANRAYPDAEAAIGARGDLGLVSAFDLASRLFENRLRHGAAVIQKPDPLVTLSGGPQDVRVHVELKPPAPRAELVVSELMILVNAGLAAWARERDIPMLFRTQDIALPPEACGVFAEPAESLRVMKLLVPPILETQPRRHAALGVAAYAPLSSPLRRYTDLVNLAQIEGALSGSGPRFTREELDALLPELNARLSSVAQIQRYRPRYWKLLYLAQNKGATWPAVLVDEAGAYPTLALPELQIHVRAPKALLGDKLFSGQRFNLTFGRIDPLANEIKVVEAVEA